MTHYDTLEVEPHASQREIKRAYRRLARRYHPDYNPGDSDSEERFKELAAAYAVVSDRRKRAAYDARVLSATARATPGWSEQPSRPEPTPSEWQELGRDLRHWSRQHRGPGYELRDAHLGALLSVSITLASNATREVAPFLSVLGAALAVGFIVSLPLRWCAALPWPLARIAAGLTAPFVASIGAMAGSAIATGGPAPSLWGASGIPFAFVGGMGGALGGGMLGRSFRVVTEPVVGVLVGALSGAVLGGGLGGFFWYWSAIFRWMQWPARDDLSVLASAGVIGALLGAALAAALGGARDPAPRRR